MAAIAESMEESTELFIAIFFQKVASQWSGNVIGVSVLTIRIVLQDAFDILTQYINFDVDLVADCFSRQDDMCLGIGNECDSKNIIADIDDCQTRAIECDVCLLYTSPSPRDQRGSRMPSSA